MPETFPIAFSGLDSRTFLLSTCQVLQVARPKAGSFFEDLRNHFEIKPDWLDFRMCDSGKAEFYEGDAP